MAEIGRVALFGKLNMHCRKAVESAFVACKLRGNPYVELVHWLEQLANAQDSDLHRIIRHFGIDPGKLAADLTRSIDGLPRGSTSVSDISEHIPDAIERAWVYATLMFNDRAVRTGYLVFALVKTDRLKSICASISTELLKIKADALAEGMATICAGSPEEGSRSVDGSGAGGTDAGSSTDAVPSGPVSGAEALNRFAQDLTERARKGELDPVTGRDAEIRQLVDILMRRRQNNPILTGEAGVGKTAVVEGFALRIAQGDVPPSLKDVSVRVLDVGLLQAGASMKGEFENRLRAVIDEVQASPKPIILFIDEAHTLIGAGGAAGTGDAANLLKPALARGTLRTIAATTWAEYKKYIEKDPALTRRFQVVKVEEPDETRAINMMRGVAGALEKHHQVIILDEAIEASVRMSHRYIPARQLPDKSVSLLDTASARVAVSQHAVPPAVEDSRRRIEALNVELAIIGREIAAGFDIGERKTRAEAEVAAEKLRLDELEKRWASEKELVSEIITLRDRLRSGRSADGSAVAPDADTEKTRARLLELDRSLAELQGETPLILPKVDKQAVGAVVQDWTGIPVGRMMRNEIESVLNLAPRLGERVVGQDHAMEMIAKRVHTARAGLDAPNKPKGVFMLCGPSGVGKTETALALAEQLYGGEQNLITINMSEFQEAHTVSTLKGAPPGYVGYGEGGVLTEAVRRRPYSVVLLDEVEKAHPDVHEIFFQVFDKGVMEDGEGREIDFKNTLILLTSNVGSDLIMRASQAAEKPTSEEIASAMRGPLLKTFPAALLGRLIVIPYYPLSDAMIDSITRLQLERIRKRVEAAYNIPFTYDDRVVELVRSRCLELESGGRMIDAILTNTLLPEISKALLDRVITNQPVRSVAVGMSGGEFSYRVE